MNSRTTPEFWKFFRKLPKNVQSLSYRTYRTWKQDPYHQSLHFKKIHPTEPIYSIRIGRHYRALAEVSKKRVLWFWIGSHADYDKLL